MATDKPSIVLTGLHSYGAELVNPSPTPRYWSLISEAVRAVWALEDQLMFAHVLNVPASEEVWPEDALKLFFPDVFAVRYYGDCQGYRRYGHIWDHIRDELEVLSQDPGIWTRESKWMASHQLYCWEFDGSFANELFGNDSSQDRPDETDWDEPPFSDGSGDEFDEEPDTLNSELLLSDEYLGPTNLGGHIRDSQVRANDVHSNLSPKRRVGTNQPTEQEE